MGQVVSLRKSNRSSNESLLTNHNDKIIFLDLPYVKLSSYTLNYSAYDIEIIETFKEMAERVGRDWSFFDSATLSQCLACMVYSQTKGQTGELATDGVNLFFLPSQDLVVDWGFNEWRKGIHKRQTILFAKGTRIFTFSII